MKEIKIQTKIQVCDYTELTDAEKKLIDAAREAVHRAYVPYSRFRVGAAVQLANQVIVTGNNQENAAFPSGICAERTALFYANAQYPDAAVEAIAIAAYADGDYTSAPISPCGACRQVILEAQTRYRRPVKVFLFGKKQIYIIPQISDLLPLAFDTF